MFICRYLIAGLIYNALILIVYALTEGTEFVEKTFFDLGGILVMIGVVLLWPAALGGAIWVYLRDRYS